MSENSVIEFNDDEMQQKAVCCSGESVGEKGAGVKSIGEKGAGIKATGERA